MKVVLRGLRFRSFHVNAGVLEGSILDPRLYLIFINDPPDTISFQLTIYAYGTTIYSCLSRKSDSGPRNGL